MRDDGGLALFTSPRLQHDDGCLLRDAGGRLNERRTLIDAFHVALDDPDFFTLGVVIKNFDQADVRGVAEIGGH